MNPVPNINGAMWLCARDTLCRIAEIGEAKGINFTVENLNPFDHPGVPLHKAMDILALVQAVNSPRITLNLDLYHAQKDGGNLINLLRTCHGFVGEVQIADVPLRDVPGGGGEVHYGNIALAMKDIGYTCSVGLEAYAPGDSKADLDRFKAIFAHFHGAR